MLRNKTGFPGVRIGMIFPVTLAACIVFFLLVVVLVSPNNVAAENTFVYDASGKRDPFIPLVTPDGRLLNLEPEKQKKELNVEGIVFDTYGLSYAIVNGEIARVGDQIGAYQVLRIEKKKIIFIKDGEPLEIELKGEGE
jgi:hypothetical protein